MGRVSVTRLISLRDRMDVKFRRATPRNFMVFRTGDLFNEDITILYVVSEI